MSDLPEGWTLGEVQDLATIRNGYAFKSKDFQPDGVPVIRQSNLFGDIVVLNNAKCVPATFLEQHSNFQIQNGDVLIGMSGSIGKLSYYKHPTISLQNQRTGLLNFKDPETKRYVCYFLNSVESLLNRSAKGVAVQNISAKQIEALKIPIAPRHEQLRIVAKIEELFSKLDAGVDALKKAKAQLKRYRQSVLAAAVTGELTKDWREANPNTEPASELLKRILKQRREQWNGKGKYKEPKEPKSMLVDGVPLNWSYGTIDQIGDVNLGKMLDKKKHTQGQRLPYLRNINIRWGRIDVSDLSKMHFKDSELERYGLRKNDLLVCEGGEPGRAAVWDGRLTELKYQKALHRVRLRDGVDPQFAIICLERDSKMGRLERRFTGSTIKHFTRQAFIEYEIPIPPIVEQQKIVAEVAACKTAIDHLEIELDSQIIRSNRLRQSTLAMAFAGKLLLE